jgi:K+-sensing histidine kinase KdpD
MNSSRRNDMRILEISLIICCIGLVCLLFRLQNLKMVVLNLFFLPVVLMACYSGRYRSGLLALFSVLSASVVAAMNLQQMAVHTVPIVLALGVGVWAATLGLTAILVGTLSDERRQKTDDLHDAYVGVVEVLSQYLQSGHPRLKARSIRIAELSQRVAEQMKLSPQQVDDIRVAALLNDIGEIEITAKVIRQAMGTLEHESETAGQHTFQGKDLVMSLGQVLRGAMPLIVNNANQLTESVVTGKKNDFGEHPLGADVIRVVRDYEALTSGELGGVRLKPHEAIKEIRSDSTRNCHPLVIAALERSVALEAEIDEPALVGATA